MQFPSSILRKVKILNRVILIWVNLTKVKSFVLLGILLASIIYGVSVAITTAHAANDKPTTYQNQVVAPKPSHYTPMGDPINDPKPN